MKEQIKQKEFMEAFEPLREKLYRFVRALCKNDELAKDIMSDTILQAYEGFEKLKEKQAFLSFLFTIASRNYKKYKWRRRIFGDYDQEYAENTMKTNENTDSNYDVQMLYNALDKLNDKTKEALILFEISGFSINEISDMQKSTVSAVKSRLKRGREKLKELLDIHPDTENYSIYNEKKIQMSEL